MVPRFFTLLLGRCKEDQTEASPHYFDKVRDKFPSKPCIIPIQIEISSPGSGESTVKTSVARPKDWTSCIDEKSR